MLERKTLLDGESSIASLVLFTAGGSLRLQRDEEALELIAEEMAILNSIKQRIIIFWEMILMKLVMMILSNSMQHCTPH